MNPTIKESMEQAVSNFSLPSYHEIPNVGLYLEQVSKYISEYFESVGNITLTTSMISNYVKKGLISNPVKKQYNREQIASLFFVTVAKTVLSIEDVRLLMRMRERTYPVETAYEYFRSELENVLHFVFGLKDSIDMIGNDDNEAKTLLRNTIIAVAHKAYLDNYCAALSVEEEWTDK